MHGLWELLTPMGRPIRVEALRGKRLAIDASIWMYQFLAALKDSQGSPHVWGFFKRICKLLYFGIRPIFVFDGSPPRLKLETIRRRKQRGEEIVDVRVVARRILSRKLQGHAEEALDRKSPQKKRKVERRVQSMAALAGENAGDDASNGESILFKGQDDYDLPKVEVSIDPSDGRFQMDNEYDKLASEVAVDLESIDLDSIDPNSAAFAALPLSTQYIVLSHLRLRSRLRMGYTKDQLQELFPDPLEFSRFQVSMVQKRNFLTQKLWNMPGMAGDDVKGRLAGDKDRYYELQRLDNGYSMKLEGTRTDQEVAVREEFDDPGEEDQGINNLDVKVELDVDPVDNDALFVKNEDSDDESDMDFEDVDTEPADNMKDIKDLYAYALKNNVQETDQGLEGQIEWLQQLELKRAIEESKRDLLETETVGEAPPIVLSKQTLTKTLFKGLDFKKNTLFAKPLAPQTDETDSQKVLQRMLKLADETPVTPVVAENVVREPSPPPQSNTPEEKPRPLPDWFQSSYVASNWGVEDRAESAEEDEYGFRRENIELPLEQPMPTINAQNTTEQETSPVVILDNEIQRSPTDIEKKTDKGEFADHIHSVSQSSASQISQEKLQPQEEPQGEPQEVLQIPQREPLVRTDSPEPHEVAATVSSPLATPSASPTPQSPDEVFESGEDVESETTPTSIPIGPSFTFADIINAPPPPTTTITSDDITPQMMEEIHTLLRIMGIPYLIAPEEAEAQCAELELQGLCDGIITDDSDCFLFGGKRVYKNMFMDKQMTESFTMGDIERSLHLERGDLIELAVMLGSDYTLGLKGVGKVMAMEILGEFGTLTNFKVWWEQYQSGIVDEARENSIRRAIRKKLKDTLFINEGKFPPSDVVSAYVAPIVDKDETAFKWGAIDRAGIVDFMREALRWEESRTMETLGPVLANMGKPQQGSIDMYIGSRLDSERRVAKMSKRLRMAVEKLGKYKEKVELERVLGDEEWE